MPYELVVDPDAFESFKGSLPDAIFDAIQNALLALADDPVKQGMKPLIPRRRGGQDYYFTARCGEGNDELIYFLRAGFVYFEDEKTIRIREVTYQEAPPPSQY